MQSYDIFISYRRQGGAQYARILQLMLIQRGYNVFLDYDELTDGKFGEHIVKAIHQAPIFIMVLSAGALERCKNEDDWVRNEILLALKEDKKIIPVNPDNTFNGVPADIPEGISEAAGSHQHSDINFGQTLGVTIDFMIEKRIAPVVGKRQAAGHVDTDFDAAKESLRKQDAHNRFMKRLGIVGVLLVVLIALGTCWMFLQNNKEKQEHEDLQTELEKKYRDFGLYLNPDLSMTQMQTVDDILSKMKPVIPDTLWMSQFECSRGQWHGILGQECEEREKALPMTEITYADVCMTFLDSLRNMTNIEFDLPSAEEWERAALGGGDEQKPYAVSDEADKVAWYSGNSDNHLRPSDGQQGLLPNLLDLYDMCGNVAELTITPFVTPKGEVQWTACGGDFRSPAEEVTVSSRRAVDGDTPSEVVGFRLVVRKTY
ncbi:MAG: SUMF1/EgtB/PvdO family nonheme iron enzyme [Bacteroidaceae bacterium]|nr:SUMF1/EgtB/PvdO family nonheme iron enzyme [Bacteroidaceae bacterium]